MGPVTRTVRIIFSAIFGAIAGFIVCICTDEFIWHGLLQPRGLTYLSGAIQTAIVVLGAIFGIALGVRQGKRAYYDES